MKGDTKVILIIILLGALFICAVMYSGIAPERTTGEIMMIQPKGWVWSMNYDAHYAGEVNEPNSRANQNNSEAERVAAEAEYIRAQTERENIPLTIAKTYGAVWSFILMMAVGFGLVFAMTVMGRRR